MINYAEYMSGVKPAMEMASQGYREGLANKKQRQAEEQIESMFAGGRMPSTREAMQFSLENPEQAGTMYSFMGLSQDQPAMAQQAQQNILNAEQYSADMQNLAENPTASNFALMSSKYPALRKEIKEYYESLSAEKKDEERGKALSLYSAVRTGNLEVAKKIIEQDNERAREEGDQYSLARNQVLTQSIKSGDSKSALIASGLFLSEAMGEKEFADVLDKLEGSELAEQTRDVAIRKMQSEYDLEQAEIEKVKKDTEGLGIEVQEAAIRLKAMSDGKTPVDPKEKFDMERKLDSEYMKQTKNFYIAQDAYRKLEALDDSPAGHIGIIFNYMKMLDPPSTVREGEAATVRNAAGVPERIRLLYNRAISGDGLSQAQILDIRSQAKNLMNAAKINEKEIRGKIKNSIKEYGLNEKNVFPEKNESLYGSSDADAAIITPPTQGEVEIPESIKTRSYMSY